MTALSEGLDSAAGELARGEQAVHARLLHGLADFVMHAVAVGTKLTHVSEHEPALSFECRKEFRRGGNALRVRVVAVVEQRRAAQALHWLQASGHRTDLLQRGLDLFRRDPDRDRDRGRGAGVTDVVPARQRQAHLDRLSVYLYLEAGTSAVGSDMARADVSHHVDAERDNFHIRDERLPVVEVLIVGVEHRDAGPCLAAEYFALATGHALDRAEAFEVRFAGVRDRHDVGFGQRRQIGDLTAGVSTHLDHGEAVGRLDARQRQRHADVIVEIAYCGHRRARFSETRGSQFLQRRLAVAAGDTDDHGGLLPAPRGAETTERYARVRNTDL